MTTNRSRISSCCDGGSRRRDVTATAGAPATNRGDTLNELENDNDLSESFGDVIVSDVIDADVIVNGWMTYGSFALRYGSLCGADGGSTLSVWVQQETRASCLS